AARAAAGWGGDRAALYRPAPAAADGGAPATVTTAPPALAWLTVWDDAGEADDFARAATAVAGDGGVQRRGEVVALWFGPPDAAAAALDAMLDGWRAATSKGPHAHARRARAPAEGSRGCARGIR
ncbi:MAG TPA: hypothetical protein VIF57_12080, partial [Polyangia bacterium]